VNGPEHYREAERLLLLISDPDKHLPEFARMTLATGGVALQTLAEQAKIHAMLAGVAAQVEGRAGISGEWRAALE
jgi:hypothetical protein